MCGIVGIVSLKKINEKKSKVFQKAIKAIKHRGPDDTKFYQDENIIFGYNRLAIRGKKEKTNQPLLVDRWVCFANGENYSFKEENSDLCDLEPLMKEIIKNNVSNDADFSAALWNSDEKELILSRDFFGVKPLFVKWLNNTDLAFASEIRALKKLTHLEADNNTIFDYLLFGYPLPPYSFYKNVFSLPPNTILRWNLKNDQINIFGGLFEELKKISSNSKVESDVDELKKNLISSTQKRLLSNVPVGMSFSGGFDSSLLACIAHKMKKISFFTGYRNKHDKDLTISKLLCKKNKLSHKCVKIIDKNHFKKLISVLDTPLMSSGAIVPYIIAKIAQKEKIKVMLAGQGADELFWGYARFLNVKNIHSKTTAIKLLLNITEGAFKNIFKDDNISLTKVVRPYFTLLTNNDIKKDIYNFYILAFLQELLRIEDHVYMYHSIENRVPFLSKEIYSYISQKGISTIFTQKRSKELILELHKNMNTFIDISLKKRNMNGSTQNIIQDLLDNQQLSIRSFEKNNFVSEQDTKVLYRLLSLFEWGKQNNYKINISSVTARKYGFSCDFFKNLFLKTRESRP